MISINKLAYGGVKISILINYLWDKFWAPIWITAMKFHGKHVVVRPMSSLIRGIENLSVDDYSILPSTTTIYCTKAPLIIGKKCLFGPGCTFITGDHRTDVIGMHIYDCNEKTTGK